ncbi:TRAP transporter substrate-binding protein [Ruminococcaceae bacterium OttesenSCG-928-I18]|nr:TRAP transporter substrate-binding protein [Ruminococcaceae bacterium OttesenSCG-928-I18]
MKTKRILASLMAVMMVVALSACGGQSTSTASTAAPAADGAAESSVTGGGTTELADDAIVFKIAHVDPENGPLHANFLEFEKYVEENTNGQVDVQVFGNGVLGGDREVLEAINLGSVHMSNMASSNLTAYGEKFAIFELPFIFPTYESAIAAYDGELGDLYNEWLAEQDFFSFGMLTFGWRALSNNVRPVYVPEDMQGIKIRVMEVPLYVDTFTLLGANPTPMSWNEIYTGLQQGTIDAQDNSPEQTYLAKFYEVQDYYSTLNHVLSNGPFICKKSFVDSLPDDVYKVIEEGLLIFRDKHREESVVNEEEYLTMMEEEGVEICRLTDEQRAQFRAKVEPIYEQYREIVGDDAMDLALSYGEAA